MASIDVEMLKAAMQNRREDGFEPVDRVSQLLELVTDEGDTAESEISKPEEQEEQAGETQPAGEIEDLEAMAAELGADEPADLESMAAELDVEPAADDDADLEAMAVRPPPMVS